MTFSCLTCCIGVNCHYFYTHSSQRGVRLPDVNDQTLIKKSKPKVNTEGIAVNKKPLLYNISNFSIKKKNQSEGIRGSSPGVEDNVMRVR